MKFSQLSELSNLEILNRPSNFGELEFVNLTSDSRKVKPGTVFVAIKGAEKDGHSFLNQAALSGAMALVVEDKNLIPKNHLGLVVVVESTRKFLDATMSLFCGAPSLEMMCFGVTGTNGKTTTTYLLEHVLNRQGFPTAVMGTIDHHLLNETFPTGNTTPGPEELQPRLRQFVDSGAKALAMEVSSHALDQFRADSVHFDAVIFTNLTRDHLDYHKEMESYFWSKHRLFDDVLWRSLKGDRVSVVNGDDPFGARIRTAPGTRLSTFGQGSMDYKFDVHKISLDGMEYSIRHKGRMYVGKTSLVGVHNLYNLTGVLAATTEKGVSLFDGIQSLESFHGVPGRLQRVPNSSERHVFVDYAHTDDALRNVLNALVEVRDRSNASAKLITVFGCGGDRDKGKRPLMAQVAEQFSSSVIVTSDNPRTEDPEAIINDICAGFVSLANVRKIVDRREAIRSAIESSRPGDILLIAGKGHEDYQIIGNQKTEFRDDHIAAEYLR